MKNKLKGKTVNNLWTPKRWKRRLPMPTFPATCAAGRNADEAARRCNLFHWLKHLNKLPRKPMSQATLAQLGLI